MGGPKNESASSGPRLSAEEPTWNPRIVYEDSDSVMMDHGRLSEAALHRIELAYRMNSVSVHGNNPDFPRRMYMPPPTEDAATRDEPPPLANELVFDGVDIAEELEHDYINA